jgi:ABC-type branched-subunit amino acid transport system ATPase component
VHILEKGEIKFSGGADDIRGNEDVLNRYLTI